MPPTELPLDEPASIVLDAWSTDKSIGGRREHSQFITPVDTTDKPLTELTLEESTSIVPH